MYKKSSKNVVSALSLALFIVLLLGFAAFRSPDTDVVKKQQQLDEDRFRYESRIAGLTHVIDHLLGSPQLVELCGEEVLNPERQAAGIAQLRDLFEQDLLLSVGHGVGSGTLEIFNCGATPVVIAGTGTGIKAPQPVTTTLRGQHEQHLYGRDQRLVVERFFSAVAGRDFSLRCTIDFEDLIGDLFPDKGGDRLLYYQGRLLYAALTLPEELQTLPAEIANVTSPVPLSRVLNLAEVDFSGDLSSWHPHDNVMFTAPEKPFVLMRVENRDSFQSRVTTAFLFFACAVAAVGVVVFALRLARAELRATLLADHMNEMAAQAELLQAKRQELEFVLTASGIATWSWDTAGSGISVNKQWCLMLGLDPQQAEAGKLNIEDWRERIHPDDRERVESQLQGFLDGQKCVYQVDYRLRHAAGHWIWVRGIGQSFSFYADGRPRTLKGVHIEITRLQNAITEIKCLKVRAEQVVDNFLDVLLVVDTDLKIIRTSRKTADILGSTQEALVGQPVNRLFSEAPVIVDSYFSFYRCPDNTPPLELRDIELHLLMHDGESYPVSVNLSLLRSDAGVISGVVAGAKNIAQQKQILQHTQKQKAFIENLLNVIPGGVLVMGLGAEMLKWNRTFEDQVESWSRDYALEVDDMRRRVLDDLSRVMNSQHEGELLFKIGGRLLVIAFQLTDWQNKGGVGRVIYVRDATAAYLEKQEKYAHAAVLERMNEAVFVTDTRGVIQYANPTLERLTGYSAQDLIGQRSSLFKSGVHGDALYQDLWQSLLAGETWRGDFMNRAADGSLFEIQSTITPVCDDDQQIIMFVAIWYDNSDEKRLQRRLLQSQKLEAIGRLAAGIAHEINTPIQYVQNNLDFFRTSFNNLQPLLTYLIEKNVASQGWGQDDGRFGKLVVDADIEYLSEEIPTGLQEAMDGLGNISRIVSGLKEFSHPGAERIPVDINDVVRNTVTVTRNEWKYVAELVLDLEEDLPLVSCDPGLWGQVVMNLIINSAHAIETRCEGEAEREPGRIQIMTWSRRETVAMSISDNGSGIAKAHLEHIFEPFFTTKKIGQGTGQGLSIVYDIVVARGGGHIDCQTEEGHGTTFTLTLPRKSPQILVDSTMDD